MNDALPGCKAPPRSIDHHLPPKTRSPSSPNARRYIVRDKHEAFFRPRDKGKRKRSRSQPLRKKRKKSAPLTNKQRQAWAREHFALHHGTAGCESSWAAAAPFPSDLDMSTVSSTPPTPTTPLTPSPQWPQQILGHHNLIDHSPNTTIPITPTEQKDMFQYWEDLTHDHENLRNISILNF